MCAGPRKQVSWRLTPPSISRLRLWGVKRWLAFREPDRGRCHPEGVPGARRAASVPRTGQDHRFASCVHDAPLDHFAEFTFGANGQLEYQGLDAQAFLESDDVTRPRLLEVDAVVGVHLVQARHPFDAARGGVEHASPRRRRPR